MAVKIFPGEYVLENRKSFKKMVLVQKYFLCNLRLD